MRMRLADKYTPRCLADIVGQPVATRHLARFAAEPYSHCLLFEGSKGVGKTSAAMALAAEIGAPDEFSGRTVIGASELTADLARELFRGGNGHSATFRLKPLCGGWHVLLLEELEWLSPQTVRFLKVELDRAMRPARLIIIATSNDTSKLDAALLDRFDRYRFEGGLSFWRDFADRLAEIWRAETGLPELPAGWTAWGRDGDSFSMRAALQDMQRCLPELAAA